MSKYIDSTTNPTTVSANVQYESDGNIILVGTSQYDGLGINYGSTGRPDKTTIQLTASGTKGVQSITTTKEGGHDKSIAWTNSGEVWSYDIPTSFIGTVKHSANFTVTWSDGTKHDPQIIINPSNG